MEQTSLTLPLMVTEKQAARILAVSIAALRRWRKEGRGPKFTRLERCVRYNVKAIEGWLAENTSGTKKAADSTLETNAESAS